VKVGGVGEGGLGWERRHLRPEGFKFWGGAIRQAVTKGSVLLQVVGKVGTLRLIYRWSGGPVQAGEEVLE
jgi:hypothetical protein